MEKKLIKFKSIRENYHKEKSGIKPNTVRKIDIKDERFKIIKKWYDFHCYDLWIYIYCAELNEYFERQIKDITYFNGYVIISWRN